MPRRKRVRKKTPLLEFQKQRSNAKFRRNEHGTIGIPWELTFEQWWAIWEASGLWEQRGCRRGKYVMGRHEDRGAYAVGNAEIVEHGKNSSDALKDWGKKKREREILIEERKSLERVV